MQGIPVRRLAGSIVLSSLLCAPFAASAQAADSAAINAMPHVQYESYRLPNGLQVILAPDHRVPNVHVNLWYHVGSKNEVPGRTGFAHLFEHMMYEGSKDIPGHALQSVEKVGGSGNGTTDQDRTEYFETVPAGALEYVLWMESDRLATLPQGLTEERLRNQIAVVENERRQRLENQPYGLLDVYLTENLYPAGHPYAHPVIGSHDDIRAATLGEVKEFFASYYAPNNLSMVIAGDFDPAQAKQWVAKYFGPIPPSAPIARPARWTTHLEGEKIVDANDHVAQESIDLAWPTPAYLSEDTMRLELVRMILNRRLSADLVYSEKPPCSEESVNAETAEDASAFVIEASARPGVPLADVESKIDAAIALLAKDGPKPDELEAAKNRFQFGELEAFDTLQSTAELLNKGATYSGDPADYRRRWKQLSGVTADEVKAATQQWIASRNRLMIRFHPSLANTEDVAALDHSTPLDRSIVPPVHPDPPFIAPKVQSAKLPNGLEIYVAQRKDVPKVSVLLSTRAGDLLNPEGKDGLAVVTVTTLGRTKTRTATQVRDGMESLGATLIQSGMSNETASLNFDVLAKNIDPALAIFGDVVVHPSFIQYSVDTQLRYWQSAVAEGKTDAGAMATFTAPALIFGPKHPYARPMATESGLKAITPQDIEGFYQTYWKPDDSALFFAGDISLEQAVALATKYFGEWAGHAPRSAVIPSVENTGAGRVYLIDKPDATQTYISQMLPAVGADSPQRFPLYMVSEVWSGMWQSRLSTTLRERDGYTYGFSSGLVLFPDAGELSASGSVETDKTKEAVIELERQLRLLWGQQPVTEAELAEAREKSRRDDASVYETLPNVAAAMGSIWNRHLPMTALQGESDSAVQASLADVRAASARYLDPSKAVLLLVGDRRKIEPGLRELSASGVTGPITLLDADGKPVAHPAQ